VDIRWQEWNYFTEYEEIGSRFFLVILFCCKFNLHVCSLFDSSIFPNIFYIRYELIKVCLKILRGQDQGKIAGIVVEQNNPSSWTVMRQWKFNLLEWIWIFFGIKWIRQASLEYGSGILQHLKFDAIYWSGDGSFLESSRYDKHHWNIALEPSSPSSWTE
jgi:hypothetical protein